LVNVEVKNSLYLRTLRRYTSAILLFITIFMPRYSVPEDLEITNKEKKNNNGCNGLAGSERALK